MLRYHKKGLLHKFQAGRLRLEVYPNTPRQWANSFGAMSRSTKIKSLIPSFFVMDGVVYVGMSTLVGTFWVGFKADSVSDTKSSNIG